MTIDPKMVANAIQETRAILANPKHFTRAAYARDGRGSPVDPLDPSAVCFCVRGAFSVALYRLAADNCEVNGENERIVASAFAEAVGIPYKHEHQRGMLWWKWTEIHTNLGMVEFWHDRCTHEQLLAALDKVIKGFRGRTPRAA